MIEYAANHLFPAGDTPLRVFGYITVRAGLALLFAFGFCVLFGTRIIERLRGLQAVQHIRQSTGENAISLDEMHRAKQGTPTMGGVMILGGMAGAMLLFGNWSEPVVWIATLTTAACAAVGFADDYIKKVKKNHEGLSSGQKMFWLVAVGAAFSAAYLHFCADAISYLGADLKQTQAGADALIFPFFKDWFFHLGLLYVPFAILVLSGTTNAVNLTDGLDGLASGVTISASLCFALVAYLAGRTQAAAYLNIAYVRGAGELAVLLAAVAGGCFGFLWFNSHPAQVFMGDTGSLMLGGALGSVALLIKQEFLLVVVGGIFVAEAASVILQVGSYKLRKKRVFLMAPLHHHFERVGVPENKIITRFWIVSALLALAGLFTLKIR